MRARGDGDEARTLATLEGQLVRSSGDQPTLTFTGNKGADGSPEGLVPDQAVDEDADTGQSAADTDQSAADTDQSAADIDQSVADTDQSDSDPTEVRVVRFGFASDQFVDVLADPTKDTAALLVHMDPSSFHYLEISVTLEIAGVPEASSSSNDVLDILITSQNPGAVG